MVLARLDRPAVLAGIIALLALLLAGCAGPSVEDQEKAWHANKEDIQKYVAKYKGMKTALDDLLNTAQKDFDEAKKAADDQKGKKMKAVNDRVTESLRLFKTYEEELDKIKKLQKDPELMKLPAGEFNPVNEKVEKAIKKAKELVKDSSPANMGEAKGKLEDAIKKLKDAAQLLEDLKPKKPAGGKSTGSPAATGQDTASPNATGTAAATAAPTGTAQAK